MSNYPFHGKKLMTPGPVPMSEKVRESLGLYECHHRSKEFTEILVRVFNNLKPIFETEQHCYMLAATGTGGLEAAMVNCMDREKPGLFINAGKFGERWGKIAKAYAIPFEEINVQWGEDVDLNLVEEKLKTGHYQALAWQACETSTGALLPSKPLAELCQKYNVLSVVDAITALGAAKLPMDAWHLDVVVGGSQKAFMLPTGMSFVALSEKAENLTTPIQSYYFDLAAEKKANLTGKTRYSTPTHFVIGLDLVLNDILQLGFDKHLKQIADKALAFRNEVKLPLFPKTPSPSLSCLKTPEGVSAKSLKDKVIDDGFIIVAGQDRLADQVLRVGHMGAMTTEELLQTARSINSHL